MEPFEVPFGRPRVERADAARNRRHLLETAREMIAEHGTEKVTMDALAERAGLGKGTVFRRFGTRAGIFAALIDDDERRFQHAVLSGPPPLGPGAEPVQRLIAYGRARIAFLLDHLALARAAMDRNRTLPAAGATLSQLHIRMLLGQARPDIGDELDGLTLQLTAALEGPLLYVPAMDAVELPVSGDALPLAESWQVLVEGLARPGR
ncbi:helix-turn-helix domain-containing protein [Spirillospora sp. NPDC029432]|uniref:TetR/AcrR family transcriptional regulator n=1 Tax=Spirillospora sp. NPDC029432 TaxID=3154599 RepID=UPI003455C54A